jgi:hypothetical protein
VLQREAERTEPHEGFDARGTHGQCGGTPQRDDAVLDHQDQAERCHDLHAHIVAQGAEHAALERESDQRKRGHGQQHRQHVVAGEADEEQMGEIAAQHEQHAVGEVEHVHHAVDQHHAERHQHVDGAHHGAVDELLEERGRHRRC